MRVALMVAAVVVAADQVTKSLAEADLHRPVHVLGPFGLALGYNSGSAFSLFTGRPEVLAPVAAVLVGVLVAVVWRCHTAAMAATLGLVLGGALGNLADRAFRGHDGAVVDFVTLTHWPTFNVADACITVGAILTGLLFLRSDPDRRKSGSPVPDDRTAPDPDHRTPVGPDGH